MRGTARWGPGHSPAQGPLPSTLPGAPPPGNGINRALLLFSLCFSVFSKRLLMKMDALLFGSGGNMCLERERKLVQRLNGDEATENKQGSDQTRPRAPPSGTEGRPEEGEQGAVGGRGSRQTEAPSPRLPNIPALTQRGRASGGDCGHICGSPSVHGSLGLGCLLQSWVASLG